MDLNIERSHNLINSYVFDTVPLLKMSPYRDHMPTVNNSTIYRELWDAMKIAHPDPKCSKRLQDFGHAGIVTEEYAHVSFSHCAHQGVRLRVSLRHQTQPDHVEGLVSKED